MTPADQWLTVAALNAVIFGALALTAASYRLTELWDRRPPRGAGGGW